MDDRISQNRRFIGDANGFLLKQIFICGATDTPLFWTSGDICPGVTSEVN